MTRNTKIQTVSAITAVLIVALLTSSPAIATSREQSESLGAVDFPIPCLPAAHQTFERGVALLHHMMYVEARSTFQEVCDDRIQTVAFAHWGRRHDALPAAVADPAWSRTAATRLAERSGEPSS